jgi:pimeloyl-ACP methyl ester carboxylesterase
MYRLPRGLVRALLLSRMTAASYGSAAPPDAVARDMQVLAEEQFTMRGLAAQAAAIASYVTSREAVGRLRMPVLVLHGDEDRAVDVRYGREFAAAIPDSRLTILNGAGHNYLVAAGPQSTAAVLEFLADVDRRRTA